MSVIVKRLKSTSMEVYVKGAPEVMTEICEKSSCMFLDFFSGVVSADDYHHEPKVAALVDRLLDVLCGIPGL